MALQHAPPGAAMQVIRAPLDLPGAVSLALARLRPRCLVLECLEIWPRLVRACHRARVPVVVVNGRLSRSSLRTYQRLSWLFEPCFASLALVTALTKEDASRFVRAGVPEHRVTVLPSSKHSALRLRPPAPAGQVDGPRLVMGSIHQGEEEVLLPWLGRLLQQVPDLLVVVAPRYPHRARAIMARLSRQGVPAALWKERPGPAGGSGEAVQVVDRMGVLADLYGGSRVAFVGGTLIPHGGHNFMEPAAQGVPVILGPHTEHWQGELSLLLKKGGGHVVTDGPAFFHRCLELLRDDALFEQQSRGAFAAASSLAGSADRVAESLEALLGLRNAATDRA